MPSAPSRLRRTLPLAFVAASLVAGLTVGSPTVAIASSASTVATRHTVSAATMPVLEPGARGAAVKLLQRRLKMQVTGFYGPITLRNVKAFQKRHGLRAVGYVGPVTWSALLAQTPARASRSSARTAPSGARVCPAPGAGFGQGWGAPRPGGRTHTGIDMPGRRGSRIVAIENATVLRQGRQPNGALRIVLQGSSGSKFYYGHMDRNLVAAGQRVTRGQVIGLMGDTGSPGAVHLHFEYWRSGGESAAVDPAPLVRSLCR